MKIKTITMHHISIGVPGGVAMRRLAKLLGGVVGYGQTANNPGYCVELSRPAEVSTVRDAVKKVQKKLCPWLYK